MPTLTVSNFIQEIKAMDTRTKKHLRAEDLIELICQLPDPDDNLNNELAGKVNEVFTLVTQLQQNVIVNVQEIAKLQDDNVKLHEENEEMKMNISSLQAENAT